MFIIEKEHLLQMKDSCHLGLACRIEIIKEWIQVKRQFMYDTQIFIAKFQDLKLIARGIMKCCVF